MIVPALFGIDSNLCLDIKGNQSFFYKLTPIDIEGMEEAEVNGELKEFNSKLTNLDCFKVYINEKEVFLNSFKKINLENPLNLENHFKVFDLRFLVKQPNIYWNNSFYKVFKVVSIPCDISPSLLQSLTSNKTSCILLGSLEDKKASITVLEKKRRFLYSNFLNPFNAENEEFDFEEAGTLINHLKEDKTKIYKIGIYFLIRGENENALIKNTQKFNENLKTKDIKAFEILLPTKKLFDSLFPGVKKINASLKVTSQALTNLMFPQADFIDRSGVSLTSRRQNKVFFNPFSKESQNFNMVISGPSGRGKSVLANKIAWDLLNQGIKVSIIDKGGSFKKLFLFHSKNPNLIDYFDISLVKRSEVTSEVLNRLHRFRRIKGQKLYIIDESWEFLKSSEDFFEETFRTFRKENASVLAISQSLEDFESETLGRVILDNSAHKFLFSQKLNSTKYLNPHERDL
ncbi:MAG: hypothetical protein NXH75_14910, partial [Halobacteriovoraceae bacterium]|nr:hypothetical protein [Halobacteriovoraceae bacterium]